MEKGRPNLSEADAKEHRSDTGETSLPSLEVDVNIEPRGFDIFLHFKASSTEPIRIWFLLRNSGKEIIHHLQLHVWVPYVFVYWDPEETEGITWRSEGTEPAEQVIGEFSWIASFYSTFTRYTLYMSPQSGSFLLPSDQYRSLEPLHLRARVRGLVPLRWTVEAMGMTPVSGFLFLGLPSEGPLQWEFISEPYQKADLERKIEAVERKTQEAQLKRGRSLS